ATPRYVTNNSAGGLTRLIFEGTWFTVTPPSSALVTLAPTSVTFADQDVGTASAAQTVILTNAGTLPLSIASITSSQADFSVTHNCGALLAAQASCNLQIRFTPQQGGNRAATITVVDNAPGSPHSVSASGFAVAVTPAPVLSSLSPASAASGSAALQLRLTGTNFQPNS